MEKKIILCKNYDDITWFDGIRYGTALKQQRTDLRRDTDPNSCSDPQPFRILHNIQNDRKILFHPRYGSVGIFAYTVVAVNLVVFIKKGPGGLAVCRFKICLGRNELTFTTETTAETILDVMSEQGHVYELSLKVKTRDDFKTPCWGAKFIKTKVLAHSSVADPGYCAFWPQDPERGMFFPDLGSRIHPIFSLSLLNFFGL